MLGWSGLTLFSFRVAGGILVFGIGVQMFIEGAYDAIQSFS